MFTELNMNNYRIPLGVQYLAFLLAINKPGHPNKPKQKI